jgi:hypothetical protein|tara:strand:+ start:15 stop:3032 length:3018 start_codon:yes stop_codon:yes gene_type:complete
METEVGGFRGLDKYQDGFKWNVDTALEFFYQFIIPQDQSHSVIQRRIRAQLLRWVRSSKKWETNPTFKDNWDANTFNSINKQALDILFNTKLSDLNANRYYQIVEGKEPKEFKFTNDKIEALSKDGNTIEYEISYGKNFKANPKGLRVEDMEAYNQARNLLLNYDYQFELLKARFEQTKSEKVKKALQAKLKDLNKAKEDAEVLFENAKKDMFNDNITLRQVMNNDPIIEQFYSAVSLEPRTEAEKIALGILIETVEKTIDKDLYETKYKFITGNELTYEEFKKEVSDREAKYLKMLPLPLQVENKLTGVSTDEEELDINIKLESLLEKTMLNELAEEIKYPIEFSNEEIDSINDKEQFIEFIKSKDTQLVVSMLERAINNWSKVNIEPLVNAQAKFTIETKKLEERELDDIRDRPVKLSKDSIKEFIIYPFVNQSNRTNQNKIEVKLDEIETNKTKFKIPIVFPKAEVDFESAYARTIGATSRNVISSEVNIDTKRKNAPVKEGKIKINYVSRISNELAEVIPGISGDYQWKIIRDVLTNFYRAQKTTTEERLQNKVKKYITTDFIGKMEMIGDIITTVKKLQDDRLDKGDIINLSEYVPSSYFKKNGSFKFTRDELRDKVVKEFSEKQAQNFINKLTKFQKSMMAIIAFAEENEEIINLIDEENDDGKDLTTEEFEERMKNESAKLRDRQELLEEAEMEQRDEEGLMQGTEGETAGQQMMVDESFEDFDDLTTGKTFDLMKEEEFLDALQEMIKFQSDADILNNRLTLLRAELEQVEKTKAVNIQTDSFKKILNQWGELVGYDMTPLKNIIDNEIDEEKDDEGNFVNEQTKVKEKIKQERTKIESYWNETRQKDKFKEPTETVILALLGELDLENAIVDDLYDNVLFNNGKNGKVEMEMNNFEAQIDYAKNRILLKGEITWASKAESYVGYKIQRGRTKSFRMPIVVGTGLSDAQKKKVGGRRVAPTGRVQDFKLAGENTDPDRLEFLENIKSRTNVLMQAVR